jgi:hypothetical protein
VSTAATRFHSLRTSSLPPPQTSSVTSQLLVRGRLRREGRTTVRWSHYAAGGRLSNPVAGFVTGPTPIKSTSYR